VVRAVRAVRERLPAGPAVHAGAPAGAAPALSTARLAEVVP
jgi:hypothetical protein